MEEEYKQGNFQKTYIGECENIDKPLDTEQINLLEKVVQDFFGYRFLEDKERLDILNEPIEVQRGKSERGISIRAYNKICDYVSKIKKKKLPFIPANSDVLEFYKIYKNYATRYEHGDLFRSFGNVSFKNLENYLKDKRLI